MSFEYFQVTVRQTIPAECLAPIERWLLTRIFRTEESGDPLVFHVFWDYHDVLDAYGLSSDDKLTEALTASRELCPELCAEVEFKLNKRKEFLGTIIDYERIFQSIVRRHPYVLDHVSIERFDRNTKRGLGCETLTIITAQSIMSINSEGAINERQWNPLLQYIERRT
jgi:hypothetical protein